MKTTAKATAKAARAPTTPASRTPPTRATPIAPPAPPPPPAELLAPRDVGRLLRYGESFGAHRIDVRWLPMQIPAPSGALALLDPATPKAPRVLDRPSGAGPFRVMVSLARDPGGAERLAALVVHVGRPPIARWTVAHWRGVKRVTAVDQAPRLAITSGALALVDAEAPLPPTLPAPLAAGSLPVELPLGDGRRGLVLACPRGEYAAYWALDAADKPVCLVIDFDVFTQRDWKARPAATP